MGASEGRMPKRSGYAESGGHDARRERPAMGHGQPRAGRGELTHTGRRHPHWLILSRGVPAATSSGRGGGSDTTASSAAIVTAMFL